jgi:hypothetical protein
LSFLKAEDTVPKDLDAAFQEKAQPMPLSRLGSGSWQLEDDASALLRRKIKSNYPTLLDIGKRPMYGAKTGANDVFIISADTRDRLCSSDKKSADLIKPLLTGDDLHRWGFTFPNTYLVFTNGGIDLGEYPAIHDYLNQHRVQLEPKPENWVPSCEGGKWQGRKAGAYKWYELQDTVSYYKDFENLKIIYPEFSQGPKFSVDALGHYLTNKCFMIVGDFADAAYLNSRAIWFFLFGEAAQMRGGQWRLELRTQYIETIPVALKKMKDRSSLAALGKKCQETRVKLDGIIQSTRHRVLEDMRASSNSNLTPKLREFWTLDFATFRAGVKKAFRTEIPVKERDGWEKYLAEKSAEVIALTAQIGAAEREIDAIVYKLFDLTPDEIKLLESSLEGQY